MSQRIRALCTGARPATAATLTSTPSRGFHPDLGGLLSRARELQGERSGGSVLTTDRPRLAGVAVVRESSQSTVWIGARPVVAVAALALVLGSLYAALVARSLPLDEQWYVSADRVYGEHGAMPVLGAPRVTYEAQMGPVYF